MPNSVKNDSKAAFDLKGAAFTILVLSLRKNDLDALEVQLAEKVRQAPDFFHNAPVVISLQHLQEDEELDLVLLVRIVRAQGFLPVGITGCPERLKKRAAGLELAVLSARAGGRPQPDEEAEEEVAILPAAPPPVLESSRIITEPIRSGQSVVISQGDLTVLASVGSGAEIAAPGSIHVYGTLRGRAFAGNNGNPNARIFCQKLEAELISIAGIHLVSEDFPAHLRSKAVHIRLHGSRLHITAL
ncbi:septum site-determining protein MinC [Candidatus Electronema sp. PJ]|uniref:septum site-determining protein MinC n=1 Tax=Candidatus Electronema sp. PJ TaxID=3401572 RepID=UPI003AA84F44